jgi:hypothetical protein
MHDTGYMMQDTRYRKKKSQSYKNLEIFELARETVIKNHHS